MKKMQRFIDKNIIVVLVVILIISLGIYNNIFIKEDNLGLNVTSTEESNELYERFVKENSNFEILKWEYEDISDDEIKDLIVIYKSNELVRMSGYVSKNSELILIPEVPAPVENQVIKLKNIDDKGVCEFIVSGSKNGVVGYSIFRFEGNQFINLFAQDMDDCCN